MGKKENYSNVEDIFDEAVEKEEEVKVEAAPEPEEKTIRSTSFRITSVIKAAEALINGKITIEEVWQSGLNVNDVKAVANHLRNSK